MLNDYLFTSKHILLNLYIFKIESEVKEIEIINDCSIVMFTGNNCVFNKA